MTRATPPLLYDRADRRCPGCGNWMTLAMFTFDPKQSYCDICYTEIKNRPLSQPIHEVKVFKIGHLATDIMHYFNHIDPYIWVSVKVVQEGIHHPNLRTVSRRLTLLARQGQLVSRLDSKKNSQYSLKGSADE